MCGVAAVTLSEDLTFDARCGIVRGRKIDAESRALRTRYACKRAERVFLRRAAAFGSVSLDGRDLFRCWSDASAAEVCFKFNADTRTRRCEATIKLIADAVKFMIRN